MEVKTYGKNVKSMIISMQTPCSEILQQGDSYTDHIDDVLAALMNVDDDEFKLETILMKRGSESRRNPYVSEK